MGLPDFLNEREDGDEPSLEGDTTMQTLRSFARHLENLDAALKGGRLSPVAIHDLHVLAGRIEDGTLSAFPFDLNFIASINEVGELLRYSNIRHTVGEQAVVCTREDMEILGGLAYVDRSGQIRDAEPESVAEDGVFILYPEELGEQEGVMRMGIVSE